MGIKVNRLHQVIGRWTVLREAGRNKNDGSITYWCQCSCGSPERIVSGGNLSKSSRSCGCLSVETHTKHGLANTKIHQTWLAMKSRCLRPKDKAYPNYGGRGITIAVEWLDFNQFRQDVGEPPTPKHTIDRKDNDKGYSKDNFRWATMKEQAQNRRPSTRVED